MVLKPILESLRGSSVQRCPDCDVVIGFDSINMKEGVAACDACRKLFRLSELNWSHRAREEVLAKTPRGCSITPWGQSLTLSASTRAFSNSIALIFACLFWNGINSVFVSIAIAGLWSNLIGPLPGWLPVPGGIRQGRPVMNDAPMSMGMTLFLCLFLIPFVLIGLGLFGGALMSLFGRVKVVIDQMDSYVSTGIGFLSWKRRFDAKGVESVRFCNTRGDGDSAPRNAIQLIGSETLEFGTMLPMERRQWLAANLQEIFAGRSGDQAKRDRSSGLRRDHQALHWLD